MKTSVRSSSRSSSSALLAGCGGGGDGGTVAPPPPAPPPSVGASPTCTGAEAFSAFADATVVGRQGGRRRHRRLHRTDQRRAVDAGEQRCAGGHPAVREDAGDQLRADGGRHVHVHRDVPSTPPARCARRDVSTVVTAPPATGRGARARRPGGAQGRQGVAACMARGGGGRDDHLDADGRPAGRRSTRAIPIEPSALHRAGSVAGHGPRVPRRPSGRAAGDSDSDDVMVLVENYAQAPADPSEHRTVRLQRQRTCRASYPYRAARRIRSRPARPLHVRSEPAVLRRGGEHSARCRRCPSCIRPPAVPCRPCSQIMDRVVVSHDWMGEVFEQFLTTPGATTT